MSALRTIADPFGLWGRGARAGAEAAGDLALDLLERGLASPRAAAAFDAVLASPLAAHAARRVLAGPEVDRLLATLLESPRIAELCERALESDGTERLAALVLDSRLVDASVARVLASDELWVVVEEIAQSPAVTAAITQQGAGFADQVAEEVGRRTRRADARLERLARRMLHRTQVPGEVP
jgi:hypothetical protein